MALRHRLFGKAARLYWRIRRPRTLGVRGVVLDQSGRIALVRHTFVKGWYLPGGGMKRGESFAQGLARELREEIGIDGIAVERVLGAYHNRGEHKDDHVIVLVARVPAGAEAELRAADPLEIAEAGWFAPDALPDGISPATLRRIAEYHAGESSAGSW